MASSAVSGHVNAFWGITIMNQASKILLLLTGGLVLMGLAFWIGIAGVRNCERLYGEGSGEVLS